MHDETSRQFFIFPATTAMLSELTTCMVRKMIVLFCIIMFTKTVLCFDGIFYCSPSYFFSPFICLQKIT